MASTACLVGVDLGTTALKAAAYTEDGAELLVTRAPTPWRRERETTILRHGDLAAALRDLLAGLADGLPGHRAVAVGFTGMAEAGYPLDARGEPTAPAVAWFDPGGSTQSAELVRCLPGFSTVTGLRPSARASAVKVRWLREERGVPAARWLNLTEWAAHWCGGRPLSEWSLAARSAFMDVAARSWWPDCLRWAGLDPAAAPDLVPAGTPTGTARGDLPFVAGAVVTVAGHDHLAAAVGAGAIGPDDCFDSLGTGEALIRSLPPARGSADLARSVAAGVERGPHVVPGRDYLFCALGSGRLLRALLDARLGAGRELGGTEAIGALAEEFTPSPDAGAVAARLGVLANPMTPPASAATARSASAARLGVLADPMAPLDPAAVVAAVADLDDGRAWAAVVELTALRCRDTIALLDGLQGPHGALVAAGGWFASPYVLRTRRRVVGHFARPEVGEAGARGAARLAAVAAGVIPDLSSWPDPWMHLEHS